MPLTVTGDSGPEKNELNARANGGTEMMQRELHARVPAELLDRFQVIPTRVREIDPDRIPILWVHDLWQDPECSRLRDPDFRSQFAKIVFVSNWQFTTFNVGLGVPHEQSVVMRNAIEPIPYVERENGPKRLIYHTTPHRGLEILVPVFKHLVEKGHDIELDVFSSFEAYGWKQRDEPYERLFDECREHPRIRYHGYQPNEVVREALQRAHVFAYPSIWEETSCIAAIEAMSAGCEVVCPNLGALPETVSVFGTQYGFTRNPNEHAWAFAAALEKSLATPSDTTLQRAFVNSIYDWNIRSEEWTALLRHLSGS